MWKKILLAALVLFLVGSYALYNTNNSISASEGEVVNLQQQMDSAVSRSSELAVENRDAVYAGIRQEYFDSETSRLTSETDEDLATTEQVTADVETTSTECKEKEAEIQRLKDELTEFIAKISGAAGVDVSADDLSAIGEAVVALGRELKTAKTELAQAQSAVKALEIEEARLTGVLKEGRAVNADRQARVSPKALECSVISTDPNWDYVILNAGLDEGIVIGSRLAVMRGDIKICELNVTVVENNRASADVVLDTLLLGEAVQSGDTVIAVRP